MGHAVASVCKRFSLSMAENAAGLFHGLAGGVLGIYHACVERLFFRNSYLYISRGPFVLSRFPLVVFCFSSQSNTDLAIFGDGKIMSDFKQSRKTPEEPMLGSSSLLHCNYDIIKYAWHQIFSPAFCFLVASLVCKSAKFHSICLEIWPSSAKFVLQ